MPGTNWFKSFMTRHKELTVKFAENTKRVRAAVSYETVEEYFHQLEKALDGVPTSNVIMTKQILPMILEL